MKFEITNEKELQIGTFDLVIAPLFEEATHLPKGFLSELLPAAGAEGFKGTLGQSFSMHTLKKDGPRAMGVIGLGKKGDLAIDTLRKMGAYAFKMAHQKRCQSVVLFMPKLGKISESDALQAATEGSLLAQYRFDKYLTENKPENYVEEFHFVSDAKPKEAKAALQMGQDIAASVCLTRDLINEGPWAINPEALATIAMREGRAVGLEVEVLDEKALAKENMNLMLAVAKAASSEAPPRLIRLAYRPKKAKKHVALVGKGVTFDSGGLDIKTADGMLDMKVDMSGAACVLGTMLAIAKFKPDVNVTGYMVCVENGVSAQAFHPGDVIKSRKGLTVEITNTDAEGRLILADGLDYAQTKDKPDVIIDLATLTGAIMIALGTTTTGLYANDDKLAERLQECGNKSGEDYWRMPLNEDLSYQLKSPVADMKNAGNRMGGSISAALFLKRFVREGVAWAHLDIAGPATTEKEHPYNAMGGTGFGVRTLVRYLCD
jgi:leucyl aminopeptidase